jgi:hypothetical protein
LLEDTVSLEVNRAYNEQLWARREKIGPKCHPDDDEGKGGGGHSLRFETSEEDKVEDKEEEEGEVTPPPHSPPHEVLPMLEDLFHKQVGVAVSVPRPK